MPAPRAPRRTTPQDAPLLGMRATLILLLAVLTGIGTGLLAALAGRHPADAVLMGTAATATATAFFNWVIARN